MRISLASGYMSPPDFRDPKKISKQDIANRLENRLRSAGWRVDCNRAAIECNTMKELSAIIEQLRRIGITDTLHISGWA